MAKQTALKVERPSQTLTALSQRWGVLLQALADVYPSLAGIPMVQSIPLTAKGTASQTGRQGDRETGRRGSPIQNPKSKIQNRPPLTLLVIPYANAIALTHSELEELQAYHAQGCTVVIEYGDRDGLKYLNSLKTVQTELTSALADLQALPSDSSSPRAQTGPNAELHHIRQSLMEELSACQATFQQQIQSIAQRLQQWEKAVPKLSFIPDPRGGSPVFQRPYLFDELPQLPTGPVHLLTDNGIILVIGSLSAAWTRQQFDVPLSRSTMRDAQELGINLLHYASARQQMIQSQH